MKIHGLCLVKNEADVIAECLKAACSWCDHILCVGQWFDGQEVGYRQGIGYPDFSR